MDKNYFSPAEINANWVNIGVAKTKITTLRTILLGIFAGMFIGFGAWGFLVVLANVADPGLAKLLGAAVFPVGLMLVILCGAELFTGNNLLTLALMDKKISWGGMLRNWGLVYLGNIIGSYLLAFIISQTGMISSGAVADKVIAVANAKVGMTFIAAMSKAILANMLVVLACLLQAGAKDLVGKIFAILFPIMLFVLSGFEHSIANMFFIPLGQFAGAEVTTAAMWAKNILPVTIGNVIGGAIIVPVVYYITYIKKKAA